MITVTVCVGSSCHIKGARDLINSFNDFLAREKLEDKVELKGSFCMERCGEGINWKINDEMLTSPNVEEGTEIFRKKILELIQEQTQDQANEEAG
jgi:NADH:ubiquinone oxidoreductase subunit E